MEPRGCSDWPLSLASTSSRKHICFICLGDFLCFRYLFYCYFYINGTKLMEWPCLFLRMCLRQRRRLTIFRETQTITSLMLKPPNGSTVTFSCLPSLCATASVYLCIMNYWCFISHILVGLFFLLFSFLQKTPVWVRFCQLFYTSTAGNNCCPK